MLPTHPFAALKTVNKLKLKSRTAFFILTLSAAIVAPINTFAALSSIEKARVITITAQELQKLDKQAISAYSLTAVKNGRMEPIPFQIDEMATDGAVYIPAEKSMVLKLEGVKSKIKGKANIFDADDELLFMLRDAGPKMKKGMKSVGTIVAEVGIKTKSGSKVYVYLVKGSRLEAEDYYVRYSADIGRAETDTYTLMVNQENALEWEEFLVESYTGTHGNQPFDTMKLKVRGNVIPAAFIPITIDNDNLRAKVLAQQAGPIRATSTFRQALTWPIRWVPWFGSKLQIRHYESKLEYVFFMRMPELRRQAIIDMQIGMAIDGWDLDGTDMIFSSHPDKIAKVDGKLGETEMALNEVPLSADENNWIWLDTHENFSTLMSFDIHHKTKFKQKFNKTQVAFRYADSIDEKSGFKEGQSPLAGFVTKVPEFGTLRLTYTYDMFTKKVTASANSVAMELSTTPELSISYF